MNLAVRISRSYEEIKQWVTELKGTKIVCYQHDADVNVSRTHVHILLLKSPIKDEALKDKLRKLYGKFERTDWSFATSFKNKITNEVFPVTEENSPKFITYMSKGSLVPLRCEGIDPVEVLRLTQLWVDPDQKILECKNGKFVRKTKDVAELKKKSRRNLIEIMLDRGKDEDINPDNTNAVLDMIRKVLVEHNEVVGMWKVMEYYDAWMMYGHKDHWISMIAKKIELRNNR